MAGGIGGLPSLGRSQRRPRRRRERRCARWRAPLVAHAPRVRSLPDSPPPSPRRPTAPMLAFAGSRESQRRRPDARLRGRSGDPRGAGHERPRERLAMRGVGGLTAAELIGLVWGSGTRGRSAVDLAADALARHDGLTGLARATELELADGHRASARPRPPSWSPPSSSVAACSPTGRRRAGRSAARTTSRTG